MSWTTNVMRWPVNEIFHSLQGEGYHAGLPAIFIRFSGCNLCCEWCDTDHHSHRMMSDDEIVEQVLQWPDTPMVVLTGGEPALQPELGELIHSIAMCREQETYVCIETNGTRPLPAYGIDWVTLSPKTGVPGGDLQPVVLTQCEELKVVYTGQDLGQYDHIAAVHRYLQPCYVDDPVQRQANIDATVQAVFDNPGWQLSLQLHRILNIK